MIHQEQSTTSGLTLESEVKLMDLAVSSERLTALVQYPAGRISRRAAMDALGITQYGDLLQALNSVNLPLPILTQAVRKKMVRGMFDVCESR